MRKRTVTTIIVAAIFTLATAGVGAALYLKEYRLHSPTYSVEEHRLERLKESAALWPDDWAERKLLLHSSWTEDEKRAIRRMDAYLRHGYYEASVARNEQLKKQIAAGVIDPCPCGFNVPYSETALLLANKAKKCTCASGPITAGGHMQGGYRGKRRTH